MLNLPFCYQLCGCIIIIGYVNGLRREKTCPWEGCDNNCTNQRLCYLLIGKDHKLNFTFLACLFSCANWFGYKNGYDMVGNPKDKFSGDEAQIEDG